MNLTENYLNQQISQIELALSYFETSKNPTTDHLDFENNNLSIFGALAKARAQIVFNNPELNKMHNDYVVDFALRDYDILQAIIKIISPPSNLFNEESEKELNYFIEDQTMATFGDKPKRFLTNILRKLKGTNGKN